MCCLPFDNLFILKMRDVWNVNSLSLFVLHLFDSDKSLFGGHGHVGSRSPSTTSHSLVASSASPNTNGFSLDGIFAAEWADVFHVLGHFVFLADFSEGSSVSRSDFPEFSCFLGFSALRIFNLFSFQFFGFNFGIKGFGVLGFGFGGMEGRWGGEGG